MEYIRVAKVSDFETGQLRTVKIFGRNIALFKNGDGTYQATEATCKHQGADLTEGKREGWVVTCPRHGWKYDLESGECLNHESLPLKKYDVKVEEGEVHISFQPMEDEQNIL